MKTILQAFEWYLPADSKHWQRLNDLATELKNLGFCGLWLPPASKGAAGSQDVGYGTYDLYDLGEFDQKGSVVTKYGSKDQYIELIKKLQANEIEVYADIVFNHFMGADETETVDAIQYSFSNRLQPESGVEQVDVWTSFKFPGRAGKYNPYCWTAKNFNGVDYDQRSESHAIFRFQGKNWSPEVDGENGNYDYLMGANLDMSVPETVDQLEKWGAWFFDETGIDGFRLDAVKHIEFDYFKDWLLARKKQMGDKEMPFVVGEYWSDNVGKLLNYLDESGKVLKLFDVPLHFNLYRASSSNGQFDMRAIFANSLMASRPDYAVPFVDNHDTQEGQALQSWVQGWFKEQAYSLILLRKTGSPVVFWGDLYGVPAQAVAPVGSGLVRMLHLREGFNIEREADYFDHPDIIGWTAQGDFGELYTGMAVVLTNAHGGSKQMTIGAEFAGCCFVDLLGHRTEELILDSRGRAIFPVGDGSISVWVDKTVAEQC